MTQRNVRSPSRSLAFTRLRVRNWRNFRDAEVSLARRAFFVGPNASGKSNLLDAVRFLRDLVKPVGGGLGSAVADRGGVVSLRCLQARGSRSDVEIEADIGTEEDPRTWTYKLAFNRSAGSGRPIVKEESVQSGNEMVSSVRFVRGEDELRFSQTAIEQVTQNTNFRDLATFFSSVRYLHVVPQIVRDPRRSIDRPDDPFGGDLLRRINDTLARTRDARLNRIAKAIEIAVPQFAGLRLTKGKDGQPHLEAGFRHWRPNPSYQTEEVLSDGTLRLIGFLWSIAEREGPLLLEEPELSLHDDVARKLPAMISNMQRSSGRQVLMTTHSEALISDPGIGLDEVHRLVPGENGTTIETAFDNSNVETQVNAGFTVGEAVMPLARPGRLDQLSLFDIAS